MSSNSRTTDSTMHSDPIPIMSRRGRSASISSSSSGSSNSPTEIPTPISTSSSPVRIGPVSPGSSPILSYVFSQSPTKAPPGSASTYPFRKFGPAPVFEEDEEKEIPVAAHARRASTAVAGRFAQPQLSMPEPHTERGTGLLRRLSMSSTFAKPSDMTSRSPPNAPPNSAVNPTEGKQLPFARDSRPRRSATISVDTKQRRAPSPMGERILKGHFDGFN
ncbi:uncharacterized protein BT62DRAFT_418422 [Guyanagaster necrorhizus]|uniref:Uncharacterized protein n=1 Tax=Guyanagaster necrorhizus TaxID=856835 RepID=A0A9P7W270_9AGAR|nr:uncharacterized protein BT62DRAFT_418422 [Guyanagaster necrorhizus MCA 3950]KAG7451348.1 hypothetical protein BT62DRAFT_418422 [Guyanagaster necrorhizus MCA 3950]